MTLWAILSGLASAVCWGAGDFAGGLAGRRAAAVRVVLASQFVGTLALVGLGLALRQPWPPPSALLTGAVAGLAGGVGLLLLYLSLARGAMGVAAPRTAVAAGGIPLLVGLLTEGLPGPAQLAGFLLALAAIWVIARGDGGRFRLADVGLPLLAGVGFGVFLAIMGRLPDDVGFAWPLVAGRVASMGLMGLVLFVGILVDGRPPTTDRGPQLEMRRGLWSVVGGRRDAGASRQSFPWGLAALAGLGDTAGNAFFVLSSQLGRLDVAAWVRAPAPAAPAWRARRVLDGGLTRGQGEGVGLALGAVVLIAL